MSCITPSQPASSAAPDIEIDPEILLELCCGCTDGAPPCVYCALRRRGQLSVHKFRQVPGKIYGNYTNEDGASAVMECEVNFTAFKIHGAQGSCPLVSLLDPAVEISHPPPGLTDLSTFSICRRHAGNTNDLWHITANTAADAASWVLALRAQRPHVATSSCIHHMRIQRFLMRSQGAWLPDPASDLSVKQGRSYWATADRFAGASAYTF